MSEIAEHAFQYEERVAAVFQSQELLSKNISEVLSGAILHLSIVRQHAWPLELRMARSEGAVPS